jgi:hypothetical protein
MKTDRELLELAAQAADYVSIGRNENGNVVGFLDVKRRELWNPLTDDGDALRLAIELSGRQGGVAILLNSRFATVYTDDQHGACKEHMRNDPSAATRRAIVHAAAAIGENLP